MGPFIMITRIVNDRAAIQAANVAGPFLFAVQDLIDDTSMGARPHFGVDASRVSRRGGEMMFRGRLLPYRFITFRRLKQLIHGNPFLRSITFRLRHPPVCSVGILRQPHMTTSVGGLSLVRQSLLVT